MHGQVWVRCRTRERGERGRSVARSRGVGAERGSAAPLMALALGVVVLGLTLVVVGAEARVRVARALWAADSAARAAAAVVVPDGSDGGARARRSARALAEANGARLVSIEIRSADGRSGEANGPDLTMGTADGVGTVQPISPTVVVEVSIGRIRATAGAARFAMTGP